MFKKLQRTVAYVKTFLGIKEIPVEDGKVKFSEEQTAKLHSKLGEDLTDQMIQAIEKEVAAVDKASDEDLAKAKEEILAVMDEAGFTDEEKKAVIEAESTEDLNMSDTLKQMAENIQGLKAQMKTQDETIKKLIADPEPDVEAKIIEMKPKVKFTHSKTHLFASSNEWDALDGSRPWNNRFLDPNGTKATDFASDVEVPVLKGDLQNFIRTNPGVITSLFQEYEELPSTWTQINGVEDQHATANILPSSVLQGRSKGWNPKGKVKIAVEYGKVYAKKIDVSFNGQDLQKLEQTWIAKVKDLDGSHPWKMSFIFWVLSELVKKAKAEEIEAMINGIFVQTPDGDGSDLAGEAIHSQNGLRWLFWYHKNITKKYTSFAMGTPTTANIYDYMKDMVLRIPEDERKLDYEVLLSEYWLKAYQEKAGFMYRHQYSTDQGKYDYDGNHIVDYPNFKFRVVRPWTNTNFIAIIDPANINKLDYLPAEKSIFTTTHVRRDTDIFADYKSGIAIGTVGMKAKDGEPADFTKQLIYSNEAEIFDDSIKGKVYVAPDGVMSLNYNNVKVDKTFTGDVTVLEGMTDDQPYIIDLKGQVIKITGNTAVAGNPKIKDTGNISLTGGDFDLSTGGTLTLYGKPDGTFAEIARTNTPPAPITTDINFDDDTINADEGFVFVFAGTAADKTLVTLDGGVEGQIITVKNSSATKKFEIDTITNVTMSSKMTLAAAEPTHYVKLVKLNGVWYDIERKDS